MQGKHFLTSGRVVPSWDALSHATRDTSPLLWTYLAAGPGNRADPFLPAKKIPETVAVFCCFYVSGKKKTGCLSHSFPVGKYSASHSLLSSAAAKEVLHAVQVEAQGKAHGLVQRIGLACAEHIGGIHGKDAHVESGSHGKVLAVTLVGRLVVVTGTHHEAVVVGVFATQTPLDFLQLFLETVGGIVKTLEDARDYVRGFDAPASDKQKVLLRSMYDEGRLDIKEKDIDLLLEVLSQRHSIKTGKI